MTTHLHASVTSPIDGQFTVEDRGNCRLVYGQIPLDDIQPLFSRFSDKAVMDLTSARMAGAALVVCEPADKHALREKLAPQARERIQKTFGHTELSEEAMEWLATANQGMSSQALFFQTTLYTPPGLPREDFKSHPEDLAGLEMCLDVYSTVPEVKQNFHKMGEVSPAWSRLVEAWPKFEEYYYEDSLEQAETLFKNCLQQDGN